MHIHTDTCRSWAQKTVQIRDWACLELQRAQEGIKDVVLFWSIPFFRGTSQLGQENAFLFSFPYLVEIFNQQSKNKSEGQFYSANHCFILGSLAEMLITELIKENISLIKIEILFSQKISRFEKEIGNILAFIFFNVVMKRNNKNNQNWQKNITCCTILMIIFGL